MAKLFANRVDPNQTPRNAASDFGLHCLPITFMVIFAHIQNSPEGIEFSFFRSEHVQFL